MKRNYFYLLVLVTTLLLSCKEKTKQNESSTSTNQEENVDPFFKLSLAQWSLQAPMRSGSMSPLDFAQKASEMGFEGIEYVSQLYTDELKKYNENPELAVDSLTKILKEKSEQYNIKNVLIMIDREGDLASPDKDIRMQAVENHKKWVDAAADLGCHAVRVNLNGATEKEAWKKASIDGLTQLSNYANPKNIEVLVENHGGFSSNADLLMEVINSVNLEKCGTLPDFGNFCMTRSEDGCSEEYPRYEGIEKMLPKAMAISAKTYNFNDAGEETEMDYTRIMKMIKDAGYTGFVGVEYEGDLPNPEEGIQRTKELLINTAQKLN